MRSKNSMQTPLARVRGLGSAKSGLHHWWHQRLTALAMVPLMLVTLAIVASLGTLDYEGALSLMANPFVATLLLLLVVVITPLWVFRLSSKIMWAPRACAWG